MALTSGRSRNDTGARHSADWYGSAPGKAPIRPGDRLFVECDGGPCISRLESFPPRIEIEEHGGLYVLLDDGPPHEWVYRFVPNGA